MTASSTNVIMDSEEVPESHDSLYRTVINHSAKGILVVDKELNVRLGNRTAASFFKKFFGSSIQVGSPLLESVSDSKRKYWQEQFDNAFENETIESVEELESDKAVSYYDVVYRCVFINGKPHVIVIFNDITFRRRREIALKRTVNELKDGIEARDTLFSIVSHELRAPIFQLNGMIFLLKQVMEGRGDARLLSTFIPDMEDRVEHLTHTLDNLLKWSSAQRAMIKIKNESFKISTEFGHVFAGLREAAEQKSIHLEVKFDQELEIYSDREMFAVILRNLLMNAIKFSEKDSVVELQMKAIGREFILSVSDHGLGMNEEQVENLLNQHVVKSERGTAGERGTGLGMKLVLDFVKMLGGHISVNSKEGKGTTIEIVIPLSEA